MCLHATFSVQDKPFKDMKEGVVWYKHLFFDATMQRTCIARKERMLSWLEKLTVDCWGWISFSSATESLCAVQITVFFLFFYFFTVFLYLRMCIFILCGFLCRSAEGPLQWLKPVETVVSF